MEPTINQPGKPASQSVLVGYLLRDARGGGVGRGTSPCDGCNLHQPIRLVLQMNDAGFPICKLKCALNNHMRSRNDVSFLADTSPEDFAAQLMHSWDRAEQQFATEFNTRLLLYFMRAIIRWPLMSEERRAQMTDPPISDLLEIKMRMRARRRGCSRISAGREGLPGRRSRTSPKAGHPAYRATSPASVGRSMATRPRTLACRAK